MTFDDALLRLAERKLTEQGVPFATITDVEPSGTSYAGGCDTCGDSDWEVGFSVTFEREDGSVGWKTVDYDHDLDGMLRDLLEAAS